MNPPLHQQFSPLLLLRNLEWILLATVTVVEIVTKTLFTASGQSSGILPLNLIFIGIFAALGWLKPQKYSHKISYTIIEFGLILLLALVGKLPLFALLLVITVMRNCLLWEGQPRSIVTGLIFLVYGICSIQRLVNKEVFVQIYGDQIVPFWFGSMITFSLIILFLQLLLGAVTTERKSREELAKANERLQQYASKIEELATLQERNRIAREIHDSLGHTLTVFNFHLTAALRLFHSNPSKAEELLKEAKDLGDSALQEVSQSVSSLRTDPLHGQPLGAAIGDLIDKFWQNTGVMPHCEIDPQLDLADFPGGKLPDRYKTAIYRIVQESLTNMTKYAAMTQATIQISRADQSIDLLISDNGRGFDLHKNSTGFGLQGMQERVMLLAGKIEIITTPDRGCRIAVMLPLS
jgi:signal transduction histidine kinase